MSLVSGKWLANFFEQEQPSGVVNGSNATFTLSGTPAKDKAVILYLDSLFQRQGGGLDYTISGSTITFINAPVTGQQVYAFYIKE